MGGAERVMTLLANEISKDHQVLLVQTFAKRKRDAYFLDPSIVRVSYSDSIGNTSVVDKLVFMRKSIKSFAPDKVISFLTNVNFLVLIATLGLNVDVTISERVDFRLMKEPLAYKMLRRILYPFANRLVVQTSEIKKVCEGKHLNSSVEVIFNPVIVPDISLGAPKYQENLCVRILMVGRLELQKNYSLALEVIKLLPDHFYLDIFGEGVLREKLQNDILANSLDKRVFLKGQSSRIIEKYGDYNMFLHTSAFEGMPNTVLEAACLGLPCVVVDSGSGVRTLSNDFNNIYLVANESVVISRTILNVNENFIGNRKVYIPNRYSLNNVCDKWLR